VKQVKRFSLAILLMSFALVATATPAFAQFGLSSDPGQRRLLGMGIISLTLIIAFLMAWYLPIRRNVDEHRSWLSRYLESALPLGKYYRKQRLLGRVLPRHRRRQFNRDGAYGGLAYRGVAPSPDAKKTAVLPPNGMAKAHDIPSDESEVL